MPPPKNSKKNALQRALRAQAKGDSKALHAALDAYVRAPRGNLDLNVLVNGVVPREYLEGLAATGMYPQLHRWFHRVPRTRNLRRTDPPGPLLRWTTEHYKLIQTALRGPSNTDANSHSNTNYNTNNGTNNIMLNIRQASRNASWLQTYMARDALRAPARPLRAPRGPLYRGVMLTGPQLTQLMQRKQWPDKGFMSFSRDEDYAIRFGSRETSRSADRFVLFRLRLEDVAPGTPWVWFTHQHQQTRGRDGWDVADMSSEQEVTLPPGTLVIKSIQGQPSRGNARLSHDYNRKQYGVADVSFTPAPEFAWKPRRKGTRESDENIPWNIFANAPAVTRKRARSPSPNQPSRKPRACTAGRSCGSR